MYAPLANTACKTQMARGNDMRTLSQLRVFPRIPRRQFECRMGPSARLTHGTALFNLIVHEQCDVVRHIVDFDQRGPRQIRVALPEKHALDRVSILTLQNVPADRRNELR